jgi:hypothetical protein
MRRAQVFLRPLRIDEMDQEMLDRTTWFYGGRMPSGWVYA